MRSLVLLAALAAAAPAFAAEGSLPTRRVLPANLALDAARGTLAACAGRGHRVAIAVVAPDGDLRLLLADPEVSPISVELSQRKARAAALFRARSGEVGQRFQANPGFGQAMTAVDSRLSGAQGAIPIVAGAELVGAIGVSGAPGGAEDEACAAAGLAAIQGQLR